MIIGISGKIGTGKSTLAKYLSEGLNIQVRSIADTLKRFVADRYSFPLEWAYLYKDKLILVPDFDGEVSIRFLLQFWGEKMRQTDENYWLRRLFDQLGDEKSVIIDDIRYRNEADYVKAEGGILVRLKPYPGYTGVAEETIRNHPSEVDLDNYNHFDYVFEPKFGELKKVAAFLLSEFKNENLLSLFRL